VRRGRKGYSRRGGSIGVQGLNEFTNVARRELREKLAHIDQMLADHDHERQEIRLAPWQLILTGVATGLLVAAAAIIKLLA
jgi:hypothetical protein